MINAMMSRRLSHYYKKYNPLRLYVQHTSSLKTSETKSTPTMTTINTELGAERQIQGTVAFSVIGLPQYGFDVFITNVPSTLPQPPTETLLTDSKAINYNANFLSPNDAELLLKGVLRSPNTPTRADQALAFVSERSGNSRIHFSAGNTVLGPLSSSASSYFCDRPTVRNGKVFYVSIDESYKNDDSITLEPHSSCAVYSTSLETGKTVRLTPSDTADLSPAVSPSGKWMIAASYGTREWDLDLIKDLHTDLYLFKAEDGSERRMICEHGGWPTWADEKTVYFHRQSDGDGWWSIYRLDMPENLQSVVTPVRVTPPGVHAFTPYAAPNGKWIAVATRRSPSKHRHIEIFMLDTNSFVPVTASINPKIHHYNPFVSPESSVIGYHRFRNLADAEILQHADSEEEELSPMSVRCLEAVESRIENLKLVRINGFFPAFSPDGSLVAFNPTIIGSGGVRLVRSDGHGPVRTVFDGPAFSTSWSGTRGDTVYTSVGPIFAPDKTTVHIISIRFDPDDLDAPSIVRTLTKDGTQNNAFPSCSPDGTLIVFRSGRDNGKRNLYVMDAEAGEERLIRRLTDGAWTDTMPSWSPDGRWIAFSSNRHDVDKKGYFGAYLIRPDGTGLHRVETGMQRERINHICFSPDCKSLLFTCNASGVSAEPVSLPNQFQPYGDLFVMRLDGKGLQRLTFNPYENGTPSWHRNMSLNGDESLKINELATEKLTGEFQEPFWLVDPSN